MIEHDPLKFVIPEIQTLEIFLRSARKLQSRVSIEAEAAIIGRIAQNDPPTCTKKLYLIKPGFNESHTDALPLLVEPYSNRPERPYQATDCPSISTGEKAT